jgi:GH24 family phage-related lysozyme (muramidase)
MTTYILLFSAGVLLVRGVCLAAKANSATIEGCKAQMFALSASFWMICGGACGYALGWESGAKMAILGCAAHIIFDRRREINGQRKDA